MESRLATIICDLVDYGEMGKGKTTDHFAYDDALVIVVFDFVEHDAIKMEKEICYFADQDEKESVCC